MIAVNDFAFCVSALKTSLINKREKIESVTKEYLSLEVGSPEELKVEKELDALNKEYREALASYNEALEIT